VKVVTVTDAWAPQVNGVVRTIEATNRELQRAGHQTAVIAPDRFLTVPCPGYDGIRLAVMPQPRLGRLLAAELGDGDEVAVHIATEGPLGRAASRWCRRHEVPFTTAYHTRFPQYLRAMYRLPEAWTYSVMRRFHGDAAVVMAPTPTVAAELRAHGVGNVELWTRGVDTGLFKPSPPLPLELPRPIFLYVGRVSVEKNIGEFLRADLPGSKVVAGEGPALAVLKRRFPEVHFVGNFAQRELARLYSSADVMVFPSRTDTFGLVLLEALACGTPVAAYPVQGPLDVLGDADVGALREDLQLAAAGALRISRERCREFALSRSWTAATRQFLALQKPVRLSRGRALVASSGAALEWTPTR
jgi:glycosyltransferase involved in cell wall biosynthesis